MSDMSNTGMTLGEFERLLDVYGGDRTRWPAEARAAAGQLVSRDAHARRMLAEAEALDRVLERAPLPSLAMEAALGDRIVAAAQRSPRLVKTIEKSTPEESTATAPAAERRTSGWTQRLLRTDIRSAAVLAASLIAGVVIGISNVPQTMLPGMTNMDEREAYNLAQIESLDEDVL